MIKTTALEGVHYWSRFQPDRGIDFNGFLVRLPAGNLLVDPMELDADGLQDVRQKGGARWILVTNHDHLRAGPALARELGAELLAPAGDRARFGQEAASVARWLESDADLPEGLAGELRLIELRGGKSPVELALYLERAHALLFGDLVRSHVSGVLCLLPAPKLDDPAAVAAGLQPLRELDARAVLLGDGDCLFRDGREALVELVDTLG